MKNRGITKSTSIRQILMLALMLIFSGISVAQEAADPEEGDDTVSLDRIAVTGSRIKRTDLEGPAPVVVLTAQQMEKEGFTTVYEALNSLTQNVSNIQDDQFAGFTQAANAIDLRGLGPGRTLLLIDGRRMTDYPLAFNGQSNIVNLSSIPFGMVDRIEILLGGASAIYGSDAIAGVVNVITKKDLDDHTLSVRYGDTTEGGGKSIRGQLTGGWQGDRWSFTYGLEYFDRKPIWGYQRNYIDSVEDNPQGAPYVNSRTFLLLDFFNSFLVNPNPEGIYVNPDPSLCGSTPHDSYSYRPGSGHYCGRPDDVSLVTLRNGETDKSIFTNFSYEITNDTELFGSVNYFEKDADIGTGTLAWQSNLFGTNITGTNTVLNTAYPVQYDFTAFGIGVVDYYQDQLFQRIFTEEEMGGLNNANHKYKEKVKELVGRHPRHVRRSLGLATNGQLYQVRPETEPAAVARQ